MLRYTFVKHIYSLYVQEMYNTYIKQVCKKHIPYISFFPRASIFRYVRESIKIVKNSIT